MNQNTNYKSQEKQTGLLTLSQAGKMFNIFSAPAAKAFFDVLGLKPVTELRQNHATVLPETKPLYAEDDVRNLHDELARKYYQKQHSIGSNRKKRKL